MSVQKLQVLPPLPPNIFARFGLYEKFKEYIENNYWDQEDAENQIDDLTDKVDDQNDLINNYENAIESAIEDLQEMQDDNVIQEVIKSLKRAIF